MRIVGLSVTCTTARSSTGSINSVVKVRVLVNYNLLYEPKLTYKKRTDRRTRRFRVDACATLLPPALRTHLRWLSASPYVRGCL